MINKTLFTQLPTIFDCFGSNINLLFFGTEEVVNNIVMIIKFPTKNSFYTLVL